MDQSEISNLQSPIFLYGPPASGKSALGRLLASSLECPFYDLDEIIADRAGAAIPEIFAGEGEAGFRRREQAELFELLACPPGVIALGGGALLDPASRARVEASGPILCLNASLEALLDRLRTAAEERPLLAGDLAARLPELLARRAEHYASFPLQLDTSSQPLEEIAWEAQVMAGAFHVRGMGPAYPVQVRAGGLDRLGATLRGLGMQGAAVVVSDGNVGELYLPRVLESLREAGFTPQTASFPAGERHKTVQTVLSLWEAFLDAGLERGSPVVALGGGVTGDLAGFAAATFLRGVPWIAAPTSLLAMADASLGGKTGADLPQGKNLVGAFHPPRLVLADPQALRTLPPGELRSGMAEVVKAGIIGDPRLFERCAQGWQALQEDWEQVVRRAMAVKIRVIQADPYENGWRAVLNLGHTFGHALELASGFRLRHGEAVSIGTAVAARLSEKIGLAEAGLVDRIDAALLGLGLPVQPPADLDRQAVLDAMRFDKKRARGSLRFVLPVRIGEVKVGVEVEGWESAISDWRSETRN